MKNLLLVIALTIVFMLGVNNAVPPATIAGMTLGGGLRGAYNSCF